MKERYVHKSIHLIYKFEMIKYSNIQYIQKV